MKIVHDYYIVLLESKYLSEETKSGVIQLNEAYMNEQVEDHIQHRRQYGLVMTVPNAISNEVVDIVIPGTPEPRLHVSGAYIDEMKARGYTRTPEYYPSSLDKFDEIFLKEIAAKVDVNKGEKIYFDYSATDDENFLGNHNGKYPMYKVKVDQIYCVVRDGVIIPQGGWCFVEPVMETWDEITTPSGIIKKPKPEAKYLQGYLRYSAPREDVKPGDHILYQRHADYKMTIEGEELYVMKDEDLLCKV